MEPAVEGELFCPLCGYNYKAPYLPSYLAPGTVLNERYLVGKLKSYNGEGAYYIGFDTITNTKVNIKEYMPDTLCVREKGSSEITVNPKSIAQYKTLMSDFVELNKMLSKMRTLNHINAATELFGENHTAYVVFNHFNGVTLNEYLKKNAGELSWEDVKRLFPPIFTTLSLVHNANLIHRGLSPESILIGDNGEIKLTGFCIADARTANTDLASELCSGYAAPEQYNSNNWQGTWTDVYGISALLYKMLTGVVPTDAASRVTSDNLIEPAKINTNIPANISKVIMSGMNLSGDMRIQTITELVTQLFEQPEFNSVRFSSSSTQTISIPKQRGDGRRSVRPLIPETRPEPSQTEAKAVRKRVSRKSVFFIAAVVTICVGAILFVTWLIALSGGGSSQPTITGSLFSESSSNFDISASVTPEPASVTTTSAQVPVQTEFAPLYIMDDLTGRNFDIISNSPSYSNLVFTAEYEYSDEFEKGAIISQSLEKNAKYEDGAEITVIVSRGPEFIVIPEYISLNKTDYFTKLNSLGIKYEESIVETDEVLEGYVIELGINSLPVEAGATISVDTGEILVVYVAQNPLPPEEPAQQTVTNAPVVTTVILTAVTDEPDIIITSYD